MIDSTAGAQRSIADWFDGVYRRKGTRYLRPTRAYLVFLELLDAGPGDRLLDVACGPGVLLQAARTYTPHLDGIDISEVAVDQAMKAVPEARIIVGNAERLPYEDATFDLITCLGSLERMLDASQALKEMLRVGKPGAKYCFLVRNSATFSWKYVAWLNAKQRSLSHAGADSLCNWTTLFESQGFCITNTLPDQYPLQRRQRWGSLFLRPVDFRRPLTGTQPLDRANEFVFLLEKRR